MLPLWCTASLQVQKNRTKYSSIATFKITCQSKCFLFIIWLSCVRVTENWLTHYKVCNTSVWTCKHTASIPLKMQHVVNIPKDASLPFQSALLCTRDHYSITSDPFDSTWNSQKLNYSLLSYYIKEFPSIVERCECFRFVLCIHSLYFSFTNKILPCYPGRPWNQILLFLSLKWSLCLFCLIIIHTMNGSLYILIIVESWVISCLKLSEIGMWAF